MSRSPPGVSVAPDVSVASGVAVDPDVSVASGVAVDPGDRDGRASVGSAVSDGEGLGSGVESRLGLELGLGGTDGPGLVVTNGCHGRLGRQLCRQEAPDADGRDARHRTRRDDDEQDEAECLRPNGHRPTAACGNRPGVAQRDAERCDTGHREPLRRLERRLVAPARWRSPP